MNKKKILIADDDPSIVKLMSVVIARQGYDCVTVSNGAEAVRELKESSFELVICDENMPQAAGSEVARWMRSNSEKNSDTPFILLSAEQDPRLFGSLQQSGIIDSYKSKPVSIFDVSKLIELMLNLGRIPRNEAMQPDEIPVDIILQNQ